MREYLIPDGTLSDGRKIYGRTQAGSLIVGSITLKRDRRHNRLYTVVDVSIVEEEGSST